MNKLPDFLRGILFAIPTLLLGEGDESTGGSLFSEVSVDIYH